MELAEYVMYGTPNSPNSTVFHLDTRCLLKNAEFKALNKHLYIITTMTNDANIQQARIQFLSDWQIIQDGEIKRGGNLIIDYAPSRLPDLSRQWRDAILWEIDINIIFHPSGQLCTGSMLERSGISYKPKLFEIAIPMDATQLEIWFHTAAFMDSSQAWDSDFGRNYWFNVNN